MEWSFGPLSNVRAPTGHSTRKIRIAEKIYDTFGLTPEDMADRISRSAPGDKWAVYHFIDGSREAFSLRVSGDFPGTQEFWFAHRTSI